MSEKLTTSHIKKELENIIGWQYKNNSITKEYEFEDFKSAVSFIVKVAFEAEALQHHPEIYNVYNKVVLTLSTHDDGNIVTQKDLDLAAQINKIA